MSYMERLCLQALWLLFMWKVLGQCSHCSAVEGTCGDVSGAESCVMVYPRGLYLTGHPATGHPASFTAARRIIPWVGKEKKG